MHKTTRGGGGCHFVGVHLSALASLQGPWRSTSQSAPPFPFHTTLHTGHLSLATALALHSTDGNFTAAFTLDGKTGPNDPHYCRQHASPIFAQAPRQQGLFPPSPPSPPPPPPPIPPTLLPRLPIHLSLPS